MGRGNVTDQELADLVERTAEAASALIRGDIRRYLTLIGRNDDYTLMAPSGGEPRRGFDASDQAVEALADYFRGGGEADLQVSSPTRPATSWFYWPSSAGPRRGSSSGGCDDGAH
jgi:hypothetical protein